MSTKKARSSINLVIRFSDFTEYSLTLFSQEESFQGPFLKVEADTIYYGEIKANNSGFKTLRITNTGNQPLIISNCKASCGCTVPYCPSTQILPGTSDVIKLQYDASGKSGDFLKTVTIKSNAINHTVYVKVKGSIVE